ncbi:MAG: DUF6062 family protein [Bacillota bacterium]|nr:DUF6062 family protein [Bacillota bacterium]
MKEKIYTIPLNEAMDKGTCCPLCALHDKVEKDIIDYTLGPSMMEPDSREESNKEGFCAHHLSLLASSGGNKLSLALMLSSHFDTIIKDIESVSKKTPRPVTGVLKKKDCGIDLNPLEKHMNSCVICRKLSYTTGRYAEVFVSLWDSENEFRSKVKNSRGFCQKHLTELIRLSPHKLKDKRCGEFISDLLNVQVNQVKKDKEQLHGFIDQFDYLKRGSNPDEYREALPDIITRLQGKE